MSEQPDIRKMGAKLRLQVCELLKLDPDKLSAGDEVLCNRVGVLKLLVSDIEAASLRGERIDVAEYVRASEALEALVRTDHRMREGSPAAEEDARNRMREILANIAPDLVEQSDREDEAAERAQMEEPEQESESAELESASSPPATPPPPANVSYLSTRRGPNGEHPAHYLKRDPDAFEVPYFPLDPCR